MKETPETRKRGRPKKVKPTLSELKATGVVKPAAEMEDAPRSIVSRLNIQFGPTPVKPGDRLKKPKAPK